MDDGKNHVQAPHVVDVKLELTEDAAITHGDKGRKSVTTMSSQVMPSLTSKRVGSRKAASSRKHAARSDAGNQKKRR
jgi:hypothetical protein